MATEKFVNNAQTTLNGSINNSTTTVVVTDASTFPSAGQFRIIVEAEIMLVTAVSTNTFTVTRGVEGTSGASHASGVAVTHIITAASLSQIISDLGISGCLADRKPATPGTYDEEFEGTADTLPTDWSWGTAPSGSDLWSWNSRWPSMLTVEGTGNTSSYLLTRTNFAPGAGDFSLWGKFYLGYKPSSSNSIITLYIQNSGGTEAKGMQWFATNTEQSDIRGIQIKSSSETVAFGGTSRTLGKGFNGLCFGLTRTSGNVWRGWYSGDGIAWDLIGDTNDTHSFTVAKIVLRFETESNKSFQAVDWLRYRADLDFPRPGA